MNDITLMISSEEQFFERGRALAQNIDMGNKPVKQNIRAFEDQHDLELFKKELANNTQELSTELTRTRNINT
jgi:hypothetical protein